MPLDPKILLKRWFDEVWNQGREETVEELFPADGIAHGLGEGNDVRGPADFKIFLRNMRTAFPDVQIRIDDTIVDGEKAVVRVTFEGTHLGEGIGLAPTGRRVSIAGIIIVRIENSQIKEAWNSWDQLGLLRQLEAVPVPPADRFLSAQV